MLMNFSLMMDSVILKYFLAWEAMCFKKKKNNNNMYIQVSPFSVESFFMAEFISPPLQI